MQTATIANGQLLNCSNVARECGVSAKTVREYYQILEDTLIGRFLSPWKNKKKRRLIDTAKFFFFDVVIVSSLLNRKSIVPGTFEYGWAFEHFILQECWAYRHYSKSDLLMAFWKTASGTEVDLILGDSDIAIEIKSSETGNIKTSGLRLFNEENRCEKNIVVSREPMARKIDNNITVLPWQHFCEMLWDGKII